MKKKLYFKPWLDNTILLITIFQTFFIISINDFNNITSYLLLILTLLINIKLLKKFSKKIKKILDWYVIICYNIIKK